MNVHETEHKGLLINETGIVQEAYSKQGIGSMIVKMLKRNGENNNENYFIRRLWQHFCI